MNDCWHRYLGRWVIISVLCVFVPSRPTSHVAHDTNNRVWLCEYRVSTIYLAAITVTVYRRSLLFVVFVYYMELVHYVRYI